MGLIPRTVGSEVVVNGWTDGSAEGELVDWTDLVDWTGRTSRTGRTGKVELSHIKVSGI